MKQVDVQIKGGFIQVEINEKQSISTCRGCGVGIYWAKTKDGKNMPIRKLKDAQYFTSHFWDCSRSNNFRKPRQLSQNIKTLLKT